MSVIGQVLDKSPTRGTARMVLTVLAYRADVAGVCYPSNKWVAKRAGCTPEVTARAIRELEAAGELVRFARIREDGGQSSNLILLAKYADRAALDDYIAQGGVCAGLIQAYLVEFPDVCPPLPVATPPPSDQTSPPVQTEGTPPSDQTSLDSIKDSIDTLDSEKNPPQPASGEDVPTAPTAASTDAWHALKVAIARVGTNKDNPRLTTKRGTPIGWVGEIVGDVGKLAADDPDVAETIWECFEASLSPDDRTKYLNPKNLPPRFRGWSTNGGQSSIEAARRLYARGEA